MSQSQTLTPDSFFYGGLDVSQLLLVLALTVVWTRHEHSRLGEVLLLPDHPGADGWLLGRCGPQNDGRFFRLHFVRQRPGEEQNTGFLETPTLSRQQLSIQVDPAGSLVVRNLGRCPLLVNGQEQTTAIVRPGDLLELRDQLMFLCAMRPRVFPAMPEDQTFSQHSFGNTDANGMVGEGPAIWEVRRRIALFARHAEHVLILGASGTGKEFAAQAIHAQSSRSAQPLVSRNAAAIPESLIEVEMFGNVKNFPNAGMHAREGLIGAAHGSTLFLDEIAEMSVELQTRLLRVLDGGEYMQLGDARLRRSDFKLVAATNRPAQDLKSDLRARLKSTLELPDLNHRREDIPLLTRSLLHRMAQRDKSLSQRFFHQHDPEAEPRLSPALMRFLLEHVYSTNVRELEALLYIAVDESREQAFVDLPPALVDAQRRSAIGLGQAEWKGSFGQGERESGGDIPSSAPPRSMERAAPAPVPVERSELDGWLVHQRRNRFCPSACQSDPHYKVNRQNANRHRCVLYAWALVDSSWDVAVAARALASPIQPELVSELERGLGVYIAHLKAQLQAARRSEIGSVGGTEGVFRTIPPVLVMRLKREYRRNVGYVLLVLQALVEGALDGGNV